jgi:hypothetical protein
MFEGAIALATRRGHRFIESGSDTCPGGRDISQHNRADVPREERNWYG